MQNAAAMNLDIKALLTLLLLKTGTTSKEIQTAVNLAAASRLMVAEEVAESPREEREREEREDNVSQSLVSRVTKFRTEAKKSDAYVRNWEADRNAAPMNSDIKALLSLLLLQNGVSSSEIQTTLRLAATSRFASPDMQTEASESDEAAEVSESRPATGPSAAPRQAVRNDHLAPIPIRGFAAA